MRSLDPVVLPRRALEMEGPPPPGHRWPDRDERLYEVAGALLTEEEYYRAHTQLRRAEGCGGSAAMLTQIGGDDVRMQRLGCGQRRCQRCGMEAREYARRRLATSDIYHGGIEWRLFVTLTMPRNAYPSKEEAWKGMGKVMSEWCRRQQKWLGARGSVYKTRLHIGWALEAHKDGWPHVHVVMSIPYPEWKDAARRMNRKFRADWNEIHGVKYSIVQTERPRSSHRSGDYLSKYIAKMEDWGEGLLAILYRRRMWSSTLPIIPPLVPAPPKWQVMQVLEIDKAIKALRRLRRSGYQVEGDPQGWVARVTQEVRDREEWWESPVGRMVRQAIIEGVEKREKWLQGIEESRDEGWSPAPSARKWSGPAPPQQFGEGYWPG